MIDTWNPAKLNEKISGRDSWNSAILNEAVTDRDSWNPSILNESSGDTPVEFEATITVTYPSGATVTCSDGTTTLTADDNPMDFSIPNEGTWTVTSVLNGITKTASVVITTNGQEETVTIPFEAQVIVTYPTGYTITLTKDSETLTADSSPYTFTVNDEGSWILNGEYNSQNVYTKALSITTYGSTTTEDIPAILTLKGIQNILDNGYETLLTVGEEVDITTVNGETETSVTTQIADIDATNHIIEFCLKYLLSSPVTVTQTGSGAGQDIHYKDQALRTSCQNFYNSIKTDDKAYLKQKTITYTVYGGSETCDDYCYVPTAVNLMGNVAYTLTSQEEQDNNAQFALFTTQANRVKKTSNNTARLYASTSHVKANTNRWFCITSSGSNDNPETPFSSYVLPCFRLTANS